MSSALLSGTFRSLRNRNYRLWAAGALVSNVGTWMQRTAQDWLVLTQLTHHNATAVGVVTALQFGPQLLLLPLTGWAADRLNRRRLLFATQATMGLLALGLGVLTVGGWVRLWQVYVFAFLLGCVSAFDAPTRQTFVAELVDPVDLTNAVALNSTSFNAARTVGPAISGSLIALAGTGWMFLINAASYVAVLASILLLRLPPEPERAGRARGRGGLVEGLRYVWRRGDLRAAFAMLALVGVFCLNYPIFISTMAVSAFHVGAARFGVLTSMMATGSVLGALFSASRTRPRMALLVGAAAALSAAFALAAAMPSYWLFGVALTAVGVAGQTFTTSTNSFAQLSADPSVRGRVVALFLAIAMGSAPLGGPLVGWVADHFGPRWSLALAAAGALSGALAGLAYFVRGRARLTGGGLGRQVWAGRPEGAGAARLSRRPASANPPRTSANTMS